MLDLVDFMGEGHLGAAILQSRLAEVGTMPKRSWVFSVEQNTQPSYELNLTRVCNLHSELFLGVVVS